MIQIIVWVLGWAAIGFLLVWSLLRLLERRKQYRLARMCIVACFYGVLTVENRLQWWGRFRMQQMWNQMAATMADQLQGTRPQPPALEVPEPFRELFKQPE